MEYLKIVAALLGFVLVGFMIWGGYKLQRSVNWSMGYQDMVVDTIKEKVKPECLR